MASTSLTIPASGKSEFNFLKGKYVRSTRFSIISSGTSGSISLPPFSTIILDDFGGTTDAILSEVEDGQPTYETPQTAGAALIATSFDLNGAYVLTSIPVFYPIAIIYRIRQTIETFDSDAASILGATGFDGPKGDSGPNAVSSSTESSLAGILKGNGSNVAVATLGVDYSHPSSTYTKAQTDETALINALIFG